MAVFCRDIMRFELRMQSRGQCETSLSVP
jgi:hypothetical protein